MLYPAGIKHSCSAVIYFTLAGYDYFLWSAPKTNLFVYERQPILKAIHKFLFFLSFLQQRFICKPLPRGQNQCDSDISNTKYLIVLFLFSCLPQRTCLCVSEINRVRKDMYSDTVNGLVDRHPLELPEPLGPIVHLQEKLFVPVKEYPDVSSWFTHLILLQLYHSAKNICISAFFYLFILVFYKSIKGHNIDHIVCLKVFSSIWVL